MAMLPAEGGADAPVLPAWLQHSKWVNTLTPILSCFQEMTGHMPQALATR